MTPAIGGHLDLFVRESVSMTWKLGEVESVAAAYEWIQIVHLRLRTLKVPIKLLNSVSAILFGTGTRCKARRRPVGGRSL